MLQAALQVVGGKHAGELISLSSKKYLIGREEDCHLRPNSELVSRHHCAFTIDDYTVRLRDLGSTNGTYVNGERLRGEKQLADGDKVAIGNLTFELKLGEQTAPTSGDGSSTEQKSIHLPGETLEISSEETAYEIPTAPSETAADVQTSSAEEHVASEESAPVAETVATPSATQQAPTQQPVHDPAAQYQQQPQPGMPGQAPMYPYPQQPMGYFQQPMGFPPQPGYYPPQYPQQPMAYPPQMMPGQPIPAQFQPQPAVEPPAAEVESPSSTEIPEVRLPDPSETGADKSVPNASNETSEEADATPSPPSDEKKPSEHAADIIRQHMNRRPQIGE
ncbi:MAG: hypothetical protein Tsb009_11420 [Planctomycetaceae bacterium]